MVILRPQRHDDRLIWSPPCSFKQTSMSFWQLRHVPLQQSATPSSTSMGGIESQLCTSTLHAATPSRPRFRTSMSFAIEGGGTYAGWNVGNRSLQSLQWNNTMRDKIACIACTARSAPSRNRTSYFATRTDNFLTGTTWY